MAATITVTRLSTTLYDGWNFTIQDVVPNANYGGDIATAIAFQQYFTSLGDSYQLAYFYAGFVNKGAANAGAALQCSVLYGANDLSVSGTTLALGAGHTGATAGFANGVPLQPYVFVPPIDGRPSFQFGQSDALKFVGVQFNVVAASAIDLLVHGIILPYPRSRRDKF